MFQLTEYKSKSLQKLVPRTNITFNQQILIFQPSGYSFKYNVPMPFNSNTQDYTAGHF